MRRVLVPLQVSPQLPPRAGSVQRLSGASMGTSWSVRAALAPGALAPLAGALQGRLDAVVAQMSHWEAGSDQQVGAALAAMLLPLAAHAVDDEQQKGPQTLREVKIVGSAGNGFRAERAESPKYTEALVDTAQTIQVIKRELIEQQGAVTLTEALRSTPGVGAFFLGENGNTNTGDAVYMRGFDTSGSIYVDGVRDVGSVSRDVFNIEQIDVLKGSAGTDNGRRLRHDAAHPGGTAALPLRASPPLFNGYAGGEHYGAHVDGAVRAVPGSSQPPRTDLSATLFLTDPADYDGGELVVSDTYGEHAVKLEAGDMILYPASSVHRVEPVTRGQRVCAFFWIQSIVRDDARRAMLLELDRTITSLRTRLGDCEETVSLTAHYHNLLRKWADIWSTLTA